MKRNRLFIGGSLTAVVVAGGVSAAIARGSEVVNGAASSSSDVGVAGPLGPEEFTAIPSYFKRVTFTSAELGQYQDIAAHLPAGRYLVQVLASNAPMGGSPDCAGVSFPLVPSATDGRSFVGYVSVGSNGDAATVSCYDQASARNSTATYKLFYVPVSPAR